MHTVFYYFDKVLVMRGLCVNLFLVLEGRATDLGRKL